MLVSRDDFPLDDDGEVLFRLASKGINLNEERQIDFYCYAKDESTAKKIAGDLSSYGCKSHVFVDGVDNGHGRVSVYLEITMMPTYDQIVLEQRRLDLILEPYGTNCDGWMTASTHEKK